MVTRSVRDLEKNTYKGRKVPPTQGSGRSGCMWSLPLYWVNLHMCSWNSKHCVLFFNDHTKICKCVYLSVSSVLPSQFLDGFGFIHPKSLESSKIPQIVWDLNECLLILIWIVGKRGHTWSVWLKATELDQGGYGEGHLLWPILSSFASIFIPG